MTASGVDRPSPDDLRNYLRGVIDPELGSDIVELGMVRNVTIDDQGAVVVKIALTTSGCPLRAQIGFVPPLVETTERLLLTSG